MDNIILYQFENGSQYNLKRLVDDYGKMEADDSQGFIFKEYDEHFLRAVYWQKKIHKNYRYNINTQEFEEIKEEIINVAEYFIQIKERKLIVFGSKMMAQKIVTLIGIVSKYACSITEYFIDIEKLVNRLCLDKTIMFQKMKLTDIIIDRGLLVNCNVNLISLDNPKEVVEHYIKNIVVISFKLNPIATNITIYKTGKISISKVTEDEKDEVLRQIIKVMC
ncbi:MAG: hypothetical protein IJA34_04470 [Lachnospiraceae bacterium]|nr:hypothetical protein [Lachnospiraceae bacterium]